MPTECRTDAQELAYGRYSGPPSNQQLEGGVRGSGRRGAFSAGEERLAAFGLQVAPEKTAVLRFDGNLLKGNRRPAIKPATFTFLGFTHYLTKTRRGTINIGRTASIKARERFLRRQADWLKANRHLPTRLQQTHLHLALNGYYQYFGVRPA